MAIIRQIPDSSRPRFPVQRFEGPLVGPNYVFDAAGNTDVVLLGLNRQSIYLIERINFSANIDEGIWLKSQLTLADFPRFTLRLSDSMSNAIYPEPVRCLNYLDNAESLVYFRPERENQNLLITFSGSVQQVAETVGEPSLLTQVSLVIYQIDFTEWQRNFQPAGVRR